MTHETRAEIVVVAGLAGALLVLYLLMRKPGSGPANFLDNFSMQPGAAGATQAATFDVPAWGGSSYNFTTAAAPAVQPANISLYDAGNPASCSCSGMQNATVFGSSSALANYLSGNGTIDAAAQALLKNGWY